MRDQTTLSAARRALDAANAAWEVFLDERDRILAANPQDDFGGAALDYYQRVHPLWTPQMAAVLPPEGEAGSQDDPVCYYRLVAPHDDGREWFVMAATPYREDVILLVYACPTDPQNAEVGYVSLNELRAVRGPYFLNVETDRYYQPEPLSVVRASVRGEDRGPRRGGK